MKVKELLETNRNNKDMVIFIEDKIVKSSVIVYGLFEAIYNYDDLRKIWVKAHLDDEVVCWSESTDSVWEDFNMTLWIKTNHKDEKLCNKLRKIIKKREDKDV